MTDKHHDRLMRLPIICYTAYFLFHELAGLRDLVGSHPWLDGDFGFLLNLSTRVAVLQFLFLLILFHFVRRQPVRKLARLTPKVDALLGLLLSCFPLLLTRAEQNSVFDLSSTVLICLGNMLSIMALANLGRSLSIMPEARRLVVTGMYSRIRHPLYLSEEIALIGIFLQFRSGLALALLALHLFFQLRRIHWEEQVLGETFPEYREYAQATHRLVPGVY